MPLILYGHPFSSYTQKVKIALYENGLAFESRTIPDAPENVQEWLTRWPLRKFPLLVDGGTSVVETSIIIEYLQLSFPGPARMIPDDPRHALDVRFLDRFFDLHVMSPVQHAVAAALSGDTVKREEALGFAREKLALAYDWLEGRLDGSLWAAGSDFTLADCAAAPALFYADWTHPIPENCEKTRAYRQRLLDRPAFRRAIEEARPYRVLFPLGAPDRD